MTSPQAHGCTIPTVTPAETASEARPEPRDGSGLGAAGLFAGSQCRNRRRLSTAPAPTPVRAAASRPASTAGGPGADTAGRRARPRLLASRRARNGSAASAPRGDRRRPSRASRLVWSGGPAGAVQPRPPPGYPGGLGQRCHPGLGGGPGPDMVLSGAGISFPCRGGRMARPGYGGLGRSQECRARGVECCIRTTAHGGA